MKGGSTFRNPATPQARGAVKLNRKEAKMRSYIVILTVALAGCAIPQPKVVSSSERSVVVELRTRNVAGAQSLADAECHRYGRTARMSHHLDDIRILFDCVL
jgi:hypothetical protein